MTPGTAAAQLATPSDAGRVPVGFWAFGQRTGRWSNEGVIRLVGFLIEGIARDGNFVFRLILPDWIRDEAEEDLKALHAVRGRDYTLHSPRDIGHPGDDFPEIVDFANDHVDVDGWLTIFPTFDFAARLRKPVATVFPDAILHTFHEFSDATWGANGLHYGWDQKVRFMVERADRIITFSDHVRDNQLIPIFGIDEAKVVAVPHAQPDLAPLLPFVRQRRRTAKSMKKAGDALRAHAIDRGWEYLRDYPFEDVTYVAVSTQDRVTKNIRLIVDAALRSIRDDRRDLKILSTAPMHYGAEWTPLPGYVERHLAARDLISMPDLPRVEHAALYHCAAVAVHASLFEGGQSPFPFSEAVSVGTPCLMARGPHVSEFIRDEPGMAQFTFDPNDADALRALILDTIERRDEVLEIQRRAFERLRKRTWADVASAYARAAVEGPVAA